jgi:adenine-specific DNA-methyltransferase
MPTLDWLHREAAFRIAQGVPTRVLRPHPAAPAVGDAAGAASGNLLIQGDNLQALKALLPFYRGRVKCIFIDPPYNTKSAFEHYDDNLEHSQWLTMMLPRLQLLRELLSEDGSIWVTIDDHEGHYLKVLMDEVFGRGNFVANVVWQKKYAVANDHKTIAPMHDHVLVYRRSAAWQRKLLAREASKDKLYRFTDARGDWRPDNYTCSKTADERPNLYYPITQPTTGAEIWPKRTRVWAFSRDQHDEHVKDDMLYWGKDSTGKVPSVKRYKHLLKQDGIVPQTLWSHEFAGHTDLSRKETRLVLGTESLRDDFLTPKPELLLSRVLHIATNPGDLVLDSFLGSGTTAAVAHKMGRRWVGIEMGEHALTHCLPRLKKVVAGEPGGISAAVNWQGGGGFRVLQLGAPLFNAEGDIHSDVCFADLAAFIWMRETGSAFDAATLPAGTPCLGLYPHTSEGTAYWLLFNGVLGDRRPASGNVLTSAVLTALRQSAGWHAGPKVVYGEACRLGNARLAAEGITFKQLPHAVPR